ncbi:MAG: hypothetical protein SVK54_03005 [candidate division WOR-3 bacterium]|nr:hypothetical protein [candidate division WOR-3 bacterium]
MTIHYKNIPINQLDKSTALEMYKIFRIYFNYDKNKFLEDIYRKSIITLIKDGDDIIGFSSNDFKYHDFKGGIISLFSGNTVVDGKHRNEPCLINSWLRICADLITMFPENDIYWHLISMGYKTYRFLPLFFNEFYPNCYGETPEEQQQIIDYLSTERFGKFYNKETGIVRIPHSETLKGNHSDIPENRKKNKHVRFFLDKNPDYRDGAELSCIAPINVENFKNIPRKTLAGMVGSD